MVSVTVSDSGVGMTTEVMARAFEPFFTTKEVGKGSGLGLSMVYGFAKQSGGHVQIESAPGQGSSVTVLLRAVGAAVEAPVSPPGQPNVVSHDRRRILVVEDEPQVLQFVATQLTTLGYEVTAVSTGIDALSLLQQGRRFDLLFTDVVLPKGMSGVDLVKRAAQLQPDLKLLMTSGYPEDVFAAHDGWDKRIPVLRKPYRRRELSAELQRLLGQDLRRAATTDAGAT